MREKPELELVCYALRDAMCAFKAARKYMEQAGIDHMYPEIMTFLQRASENTSLMQNRIIPIVSQIDNEESRRDYDTCVGYCKAKGVDQVSILELQRELFPDRKRDEVVELAEQWVEGLGNGRLSEDFYWYYLT